MSEQEIAYLTKRAARQLELAQQATLPQVTAAHYAIATAYLERLSQLANEQASGAPTLEHDLGEIARPRLMPELVGATRNLYDR